MALALSCWIVVLTCVAVSAETIDIDMLKNCGNVIDLDRDTNGYIMVTDPGTIDLNCEMTIQCSRENLISTRFLKIDFPSCDQSDLRLISVLELDDEYTTFQSQPHFCGRLISDVVDFLQSGETEWKVTLNTKPKGERSVAAFSFSVHGSSLESRFPSNTPPESPALPTTTPITVTSTTTPTTVTPTTTPATVTPTTTPTTVTPKTTPTTVTPKTTPTTVTPKTTSTTVTPKTTPTTVTPKTTPTRVTPTTTPTTVTPKATPTTVTPTTTPTTVTPTTTPTTVTPKTTPTTVIPTTTPTTVTPKTTPTTVTPTTSPIIPTFRCVCPLSVVDAASLASQPGAPLIYLDPKTSFLSFDIQGTTCDSSEVTSSCNRQCQSKAVRFYRKYGPNKTVKVSTRYDNLGDHICSKTTDISGALVINSQVENCSSAQPPEPVFAVDKTFHCFNGQFCSETFRRLNLLHSWQRYDNCADIINQLTEPGAPVKKRCSCSVGLSKSRTVELTMTVTPKLLDTTCSKAVSECKEYCLTQGSQHLRYNALSSVVEMLTRDGSLIPTQVQINDLVCEKLAVTPDTKVESKYFSEVKGCTDSTSSDSSSKVLTELYKMPPYSYCD